MRSEKTKAINDVSIYMIGTLARHIVGFLMLPVYTRYLTPEDYGVVALLMVSLSVFELFFGARVGDAIQKFYFENNEQEYRNTLVSTALISSSLISFVAYIFLHNLSESVSAGVLGTEEYAGLMSILFFLIVSTVFENYGFIYLRLTDKPKLYVALALTRLVLQLSMNIWFVVYLEWGVKGVVYSATASSCIFATIQAIHIYRKVGSRIDIKLMAKLYSYSWPLWIAGFASLYIGFSSRYFIRLFSVIDEVGLYELASKLASILVILIWRPFGLYWDVERYKIYNSQHTNTELYSTYFNLMFTLLIFSSVAICIFSEGIIHVMASVPFHGSYAAVLPLVISLLFRSLSDFFNFSFLVTGSTAFIAYIKYLSAGVLTLLMFLLVQNYGFIGIAYAQAITSIVIFVLTYVLSLKFYDMNVKFKLITKLIFISVIALTLAEISVSNSSLATMFLYKPFMFLLYSVATYLMIFNDKPLFGLLVFIAKHYKGRLTRNYSS